MGASSEPIWTTENDVRIFRWLWMLRVLTVEQVRRLAYYQPETGRLSNLNNVRTRLKRLEDAGFLRGDFIREEGLNKRQKVYLLGKVALPALRRYGIEQKQLYDFKNLNAYQQIYHALLVSECAVRVWEAVRNTSVVLPHLQPFNFPFYHTHCIEQPRKKRHVERFVTQCDVLEGLGARHRIRPDLVFALRQDQRERLFFVEADRGFEGHQEILEKLTAYWQYAQAESSQVEPPEKCWTWYGSALDFRVLLVTTTERRIEGLQKSFAGRPEAKLVAMTTAELFMAQNPVFEPLWWVGEGDRKALLNPS